VYILKNLSDQKDNSGLNKFKPDLEHKPSLPTNNSVRVLKEYN